MGDITEGEARIGAILLAISDSVKHVGVHHYNATQSKHPNELDITIAKKATEE